jgi:hypothetical protein
MINVSKIIYKSNPIRYYLNEGFLFENPNQAIKFLKEKNLDPTISQEGKNIFNNITGITKGDGYTYLMTRFHIIDKLPLTDIQKLHNFLKTNKDYVNRLPKPVVTYTSYRELRADLDELQGMRNLKRLYNELPANLKQQHQYLDVTKQQELKELAGKFNMLTPEQQNFFIKKISGYKDIQNFIDNLRNYIFSIENKEDYNSIKEKIGSTPNAFIAYDNPEQNIIIAHVNSFDASKNLGCTSSWCITRDAHYWRNYMKGGNKYFFIWDFNYPASDTNYLIGTAYNPKQPNLSKTHLKDNVPANLSNILIQKNLNKNIFSDYIKRFMENILRSYSGSTGLMSAMKNVSQNPEALIDIIKNSQIIQEFGDPEDVKIYGDSVKLGISNDKMKEMLDLDDEYDYIYNTAYSNRYNSGDYYDSDEANYMHNGLNKDNIELLISIAKKLGVPKNEYLNFGGEEGAIYKFLDKYNLTEILDTYLSEYSEAQERSESSAATELINQVPFDVQDGSFNINDMLKYIIDNEIIADNFDTLVNEIKDKIPEFSYDSLSNARYSDLDLDDLNTQIKSDLSTIIDNIENDPYVRAKVLKETNNELIKLGFKLLSNNDDLAQKKFKNVTITINDAEFQETEEDTKRIIIKAALVYNDNYYKKLGKIPPKSRNIKIPLISLRNYIQQTEIPFKLDENRFKKIVQEELGKVFDDAFTGI